MNLLENYSEEIRNIFYHELGHFIAFKLNTKELEGFSISEIKIFHCPQCYNKIGGQITPSLPKDFDNNSYLTPKKIAQKLTNLYFGCIFQKLLSNSTDDFSIFMGEIWPSR